MGGLAITHCICICQLHRHQTWHLQEEKVPAKNICGTIHGGQTTFGCVLGHEQLGRYSLHLRLPAASPPILVPATRYSSKLATGLAAMGTSICVATQIVQSQSLLFLGSLPEVGLGP